MTGVHDVGVELPVLEHEEIAVPAGAAQQDDVVTVYLADGLHGALVQRFELLVEFVFVFEVVGNGFVHQFVAEDDRLLGIAAGDALPDVAEQLLARLALEEPGVAIAVVDVVAGLRPRTVVHVENEVETCLPTPVNNLVDALEAVLLVGEAHVVLMGEELVVERQADGVGARALDVANVGLGDVVVLELPPEAGCLVGSHGLLQQQVDHPGGVGLREAEHVALGVEPVAQVGALDVEAFAVGLDEVGALYVHEAFLGQGLAR